MKESQDKTRQDSTQTESRRSFIKKTAGLAAVSLIGPSTGWAGANERIRVAVCGIRGQGRTHIGVRETDGKFQVIDWGGYSNIKGAEVAVICDIDERQLAKRVAELKSANLPIPQLETDVRRVIDDKSIDAVSIATPNHWHSPHQYLGMSKRQRCLCRKTAIPQHD